MCRMLVALLLSFVSFATADYAMTRESPERRVDQQGAATATPEGQAVIFIFMKSSLVTQDAAPKVAVDDSVFCGISGGTYCTVTVRSGKHKVTATLLERRRVNVDLDVLAGETYYLEVAPKFSHLELFAVPKEKAVSTVSKARAIDPVGPEVAVMWTHAYWREERKRVKALADQLVADPICKPLSSFSAKCQAYPGDERPKRDTAIVKLSDLNAKSLDGKDLKICYMPRGGQLRNRNCKGLVTSIELLPGEYRIEFELYRSGVYSTGTQFFDLTAEAGETYKLIGRFTTNRMRWRN